MKRVIINIMPFLLLLLFCNITPSFAQQVASDFSVDKTTVCKGDCVKFSDQSTPAGSPLTTWAWTFEGGIVTGTSQNTYIGKNPPNVCYSNSGSFDVTLYVSDGTNQNTLLKKDYIVVTALTSNFSLSQSSICLGSNTTVTYGGNAPTNATYTWNFDGGMAVPGTGQGPQTINWATAGNKTVSLYVTDGSCTSTLFSTTILVNDYPSSSFSLNPSSVCSGGSVTVTYTGTASSGSSYQWNFDGGNVINGADQGPYQISWFSPGAKIVTLIVTENGCASSVASKIDTVNNCTGNNNIHLSSVINIYPNPVSSNLSITSSSNEIEFKDLLGRTIYQQGITEKQTTINVSEFPAGIYLAVLKNEDGSGVVRKFVKQ